MPITMCSSPTCGRSFYRSPQSAARLCPQCRKAARRRQWITLPRTVRGETGPGPLERGIEQRLAIRGYEDGWSGFAPPKRKEGA